MATIVRGTKRPFGPICNDTSGAAVTHRQVGGVGTCRWKMLMNGMHLEGQWNCVEYVVIEPGSSVGEHVHMRTEEIYYIVSGEAVVTMDGTDLKAVPGDLVTTPIGSSHSIANHGAQDMHFFVVEVFPGEGVAAPPAQVHVPTLLVGTGGIRSAAVDLTPHFTGDWYRFSLLEIPAGGAFGDTLIPDRSQVLHTLAGSAAITVEGVRYTGGAGLSGAVPPHHSYKVESDGTPLSVISTQVRVG
jgi:mannose-6-phosphate isomerase-like protein (cupin superfamily)